MAFSISSLFGGNSSSAANTVTSAANVAATTPGTNNQIQEGETYQQYGKRVCGLVNGSLHALAAYLSSVRIIVENRFRTDLQAQEEYKNRIKAEITEEQANLESARMELQSLNDSIASVDDAISEKRGEISTLEAGDSINNRESKVKFWFGVAVLALLTLFLFFFYTSTFYSAFFGGDTVDNVTEAMFNSQAIAHAYEQGFSSLFFVCCAPMIFMALGYLLHYFSVQQGIGKYFKTFAVVAVTLMFDLLLAFSIAQAAYNQLPISLEKPFSMSIAVSDINVWIVIACGFVTYMIWGLVLDMTLSAYGEFKYASTSIQNLRNEIARLEAQRQKLLEKVAAKRPVLAQFEGRINTLQDSLNLVVVPLNLVKEALADFYAGWCTLVATLNPQNYDPTEAKLIYDTCVQSLNLN